MNISEEPFIELNLHVEDGALAILCEDETLGFSLASEWELEWWQHILVSVMYPLLIALL
jgi:hypothetical protein